MAAAITHFLQCASQLFLRVSHATVDDSDQSFGKGFDVAWSIDEFQQLVDRLAWSVDASTCPTGDAPLRELTKASWKVSQDIILRLQRSQDTASQAGTQPGASGASSGATAWVDSDVEAFGMKLSELKSQWKVLRLDHG
jgi:hypothetical protein